MDKLIQTIQEEINQLMNSRLAKRTDIQLVYEDNKMIPFHIVKVIMVEYSNGTTLVSLKEKYGYDKITIAKNLRLQGVELRDAKFNPQKARDSHHTDEKLNDIKNGIKPKEFMAKWNCSRASWSHYKKTGDEKFGTLKTKT